MSNDTINSASSIKLNPNQTNPDDYHTRLDWFLPFSITLILMFMSLWTLISLVYYGSMTGKWKRIQPKKSNQLNVGMVYVSLVVCALACVTYLSATLLYMSVGFNDDEDYLCNIVGDLANCTYGFVLFSVYMFLWLRQRVFYQNRMLNVTYSRTIQAFSSISIIVIIVAGMSVLVFIALPYNHRSSPNGCVYLPDNELRVGYWISVVVVGVFGQTILLGLFFYALKQSRGNRWSKSSKVPCCGTLIDIFYTKPPKKTKTRISSSDRSRVRFSGAFNPNSALKQSSKTKQNHSNNIRIIMRKTLLFAMLSTTLDLVFQIHVHYIADEHHHRRLDAALGSVCGYINVLCRVLSFSAFRKMLFPFCTKLSASNNSDAPGTSS